ncbi:MAG: S9 family peptidase [Bacteroidota bacterium]
MMRITALCCVLLVQVAAAQEKIKLQHVVDGTFSAQSVRNVNWMNDGGFYTALDGNAVKQYSIQTGEVVETLVDGQALDITIAGYEFSADEQQILLLTERKSIYRRSFVGIYYAYDLENARLIGKVSSEPCSYATFSPDGRQVAFVQDNNLKVTDLKGKTEALTGDGKFNEIINGSADWVYEEELYLTKAFAWSPDGKYLAYVRFNESGVREYNLQYWDEGALYPTDYRYKYPKAGEDNSTVEVWCHHLPSGKRQKIDIGQENDIYVPRLSWTPDNQLSVQKLNRWQNTRELFHANPESGKSDLILQEVSDTYVHLTFCDDLKYLDGDRFLYSSERDGNKHFYLYQNDGKLINQITSGRWDAEKLVALDEKRDLLYFTSTEVSPMERHLFRIALDGRKKEKLTTTAGVHAIDMSPDSQYYMDFSSSADRALTVELFETRRQRMIKVLVDNESLNEKISDYQLSPKEFFSFENSEGDALNGYLLKPADFDEGKEYPLLMFQYSGPGSQQVMNSNGGSHFIWHQFLVQQGYIVAVLDPRGTGGRGESFKKMTYLQLGKYEAEDHIEAARYFGRQPYIDQSRIGIWGWSYGGYISSLAMFRGAGAFKAAIAVAPVTSWRFYDTIYTERYLRRPQDNAEGYDDNSPLTYADKLEGAFLLIHGTGDDNVHFSNSVALQEKLIQAGKQFQSFYYPDRAHGLRGPGGRLHLYQMMTDFILESL